MNKCTLRDITEQIYDGKHGGCTEKSGTGLYFISVKDIGAYDIDYDEAMEISQEEFNEIYSRTKLENGDTIFANTGDTIGKSVFIEGNQLTEKTAFQKSVAVLKPNAQVVPRYLFYLMQNEKARLRLAATGSGQKNLLLDTMRKFEVEISDPDSQKYIAEVMGYIDDKAKLNTRVIKEIGKVIEMIFHYWFTQYAFPDNDGKPYCDNGGELEYNEVIKEKIPKSWEVAPIGNIIMELPKSEVKAGDEVHGKFPLFKSGAEIGTYNDYLVDGANCYLSTGGNAVIKYYTMKAAYSTDTWCITGIDGYKEYLYLYLNSMIDVIQKSYFAGSGLKHLQKDSLKAIQILIPPKSVVKKFEERVAPLFDAISQRTLEIKELEELHDFLLPLMMAEQIRPKK